MKEQFFIEQRRARWTAFEQLLHRIQAGGPARLSGNELVDFSLGYRALTTDLAIAQSRRYDGKVIRYLNRVVAGGYAALYQNQAENGWHRVARFFMRGFPGEVRRSFGIIAVCAALFWGATLLSAVLVAADPDNAYAFLPDQQVTQLHKSLHDSNFAFDRRYSSVMATQIITNNVRVAALSFAGGMTGGVLTVSEVLENGFMLGGMGMLFAHAGFGYDFVATIAPHGVIELTSIILAASGGLLIAGAFIAPGRLKRRDALTAAARRAGVLVLGSCGLLVVAGTIEGFFTPMRTPPEARIGVGIVTGVLLLAYLAFAGRGAAGEPRLTRK